MGTTCSIPGFGIARRLNIREFIGLLRVHLKATVHVRPAIGVYYVATPWPPHQLALTIRADELQV
jgi:hypothetical protein